MGILDEAIREHLELKRRRGADLDQVKLQEREVFGAQPVAQDSPLPSEGVVTDVAQPQQPDISLSQSADHSAIAAGDPLTGTPQPTLEPSVPAPAAGVDVGDPLSLDTTQSLAEPAIDVDQPTASYSAQELANALGQDQDQQEHPESGVEPVLAAEDEKKQQDKSPSEDVLAQTPEFLEQAPEHDRLWFEQRPPRDFDFDD